MDDHFVKPKKKESRMSNSKNEKYQSFLSTYSDMDESLIEAIVAQLGGVDTFQEIHEDIPLEGIQTGFYGFIARQGILDLFKNNKASFLDFFLEEGQNYGLSSAAEFIRSSQELDEKDFTDDELAEAMNNPETREQQTVVIRMVGNTTETLCTEYANFIQIFESEMAA